MNITKKSLVVAVILLFIGISIAPSINHSVVTASQDDDLVEVTAQTCGIKGYGNTTVKLTKEQYQDLEQYLVEFRERLNQTSTREDAVPIFKEAVVELNKYGLLPKGMRVEQAQRVVTGQFCGKKYSHLFSKTLPRTNLSKYNYLALVSGNVSGAPFMSTALMFISYILAGNPPFTNFVNIRAALWFIGLALLIANMMGSNLPPIPISFLTNIYMISDMELTCTGWVETFGLLGKKSYEGTLNGILSSNFPDTIDAGIFGFTGIKIHTGTEIYDYFFFGSALAVGIDDTQ